MPRSGWLAVGATAAASVHAAVGAAVPTMLAVAALGLFCLVLPSSVRRPLLVTVIGGTALLLRVVAAPGLASADVPPDGDGPWIAVVETMSAPRDGAQVATLRLIQEDGRQPPARLATTLPRYPAVQPGDTVRIDGQAQPRPDSPYGAYLERIGVAGTLRSRTLELVPATEGPAAVLEGIRRAAGERLAAVLPEPEAGLAAGILIGLRDRVDREVAAAFTTAGVSHVVAISGWNIAIVAAAVAAVAGGLGRRRRSVATAVAIALYVAFAGASASVLRAGAMAGVVLLARESGRAGQAAAALGWAAFLLLLVDPAFAADAGFQLSTLATAGLIAWATPTTASLQRRTGGRVPRWITETLGVSLAAQLATLPIVVVAFGRIALIAPALNLVVVPLVAPVMAAGILALGGGILVGLGAPDVVGSVLAVPAWVGLRTMIALVFAAAGVPYASVEVEPPVGTLLGASLVLLIAVIVLSRRGSPRASAPSTASVGKADRVEQGAPTRGRRLAVLALVVSLACSGAVAAARPSGVARLSVLDVGQGDAILLEGAEGGRLLIDGGPDPDRLLVELDGRLPPWDRRIDVVILSHPHEDHVAGLAMLLARYRVGTVLEPGMRGAGPGYEALTAVLADGAPRRATIGAGDRLAVDDIELSVLWPIPGTVPAVAPDDGTAINNVSVVLLGTIGERRILLAGDVEEEVDPTLLAADLPVVDVLKVAHHGSRTATTEAFVQRVRPAVAIASAGAGNPYGHPARATVDRLAAAGARVLRTDLDGTVTVEFRGDAMTVRRSGGRRTARAPGGVAAAVAAARAVRPASFLCAIPGFGEPVPAPGPPVDRGSAARAAAGPTLDRPGDTTGAATTVGYHRADDGPQPGRGSCPAALPGSPAVVHGARARRRRGGGLAGVADRRRGDRRGPGRCRDRRTAARRRQAPARDGAGARPPPWRGLRGVARTDRPPGAVATRG